ncbi:MAG: tetratricopeptide repeat protein, partial [Anaerolineae bacterium]
MIRPALRTAGVLVLVALLTTAVSPPADRRFIEAVQRGDRHFAVGEYYTALQAYQQAAVLAPASQEVMLRTAEAHLARHEIGQAVYLLRRVYPHARGQRLQRVMEGLGQAAFLQGDRETARRWWEMALQAGESAPAHRGLAMLAEAEGEDAPAVRHWEGVLALSLDDPEALCHLAWLALARPEGPDQTALQRAEASGGPCADAAGELLRIFAAPSLDAHAYARAGILLLQRGELEFALRMLERAISLEP